MMIALGITIAFMAAEIVGGLLTNSLALLADAGHMATDVVALVMSLGAWWYSSRPAPHARSWGYHRVEVLVALGNGVLLVCLVAFITWQAVQRLANPEAVRSVPMLAVAAAGLLANAASGLALRKGASSSVSAQGALANVISDGLGSVGVIIGGIVMLVTGWYQADAVAGMVVGALILFTAWRLLRATTEILLEATPKHIVLEQVHQAVMKTPGVVAAHDLHVWTLTTGFVAMSGHVVVDSAWHDGAAQHHLLTALRERLHEGFGIDHMTVQVETEELAGEESHCEGEPVCLA
jgi:cobalt-zinc-cadmium efflux system protein